MEKLLLGRLTELLILHEYQTGFGKSTPSVTKASLRFTNASRATETLLPKGKGKNRRPSETSTLDGEDLSDVNVSCLSFSSPRPSDTFGAARPSESTLSGGSRESRGSDTSQPSVSERGCPLLLKQLCEIAFLKLKPFHNQGPEFWHRFQIFLDGSFIDSIEKLSKGTQFDTVKFSMFYMSLIWNLKSEIWQKPASSSTTSSEEESIAELMKNMPVNYQALWHRYLSRDPNRTGSFHLALSQACHMPDEQRIHKLNGFVNSWKQLLVTLSKVSRHQEVEERTEKEQEFLAGSIDPEAFWKAIAEAPRLSDLEPKWRDLIDVTVSVIARTFDHILDHPGRRRKINGVVSKLPINLLIMTLKLLQPLKMLDKMLRVLLWRPKGSKTILYKLAGILCDMETTEKMYKSFKQRLPSSRRSEIQSILSSKQEVGLDSRVSVEVLSEILSSQLMKVNEIDLEYAKVLLRHKEKQEFMGLFGGEGSVETYMPLIQCFLLLVGEANKCCDLSFLVSTVFHALKQTMDALKVYEEHHNESKVPLTRDRSIPKRVGAAIFGQKNRQTAAAIEKDSEGEEESEKDDSDVEDVVDQFRQATVGAVPSDSNIPFDSHQQMLNNMKARQHGASARVHANVIGNIEAIWYQFFDQLYPVLHGFSKKPSSAATDIQEKPLRGTILENLTNQVLQYQSLLETHAKEYLAWVNTDAPSLTSRILNVLKEDEQKQLWQEVKVMAFMCSEGIPEEEWPDLPMIHERAFGIFYQEIRSDVDYVKQRVSAINV